MTVRVSLRYVRRGAAVSPLPDRAVAHAVSVHAQPTALRVAVHSSERVKCPIAMGRVLIRIHLKDGWSRT